jgi:hypothetical protein
MAMASARSQQAGVEFDAVRETSITSVGRKVAATANEIFAAPFHFFVASLHHFGLVRPVDHVTVCSLVHGLCEHGPLPVYGTLTLIGWLLLALTLPAAEAGAGEGAKAKEE